MSKSVKFTRRKRVTVIDGDGGAPFWLEHIGLFIVAGLAVVVGGMILLALTDWGRAAMVWGGLGFGVLMAVWLAIDPWRSLRTGEPLSVWVGEAIAALGWGGLTVSLAAGIPYVFWRGQERLPEWAFALPGAGAVVFTGIATLGMWLQTRQPLPALDRRPRVATVILNTDDADGGQCISVRYLGVDDREHDAELADLIDETWRGRFAAGTTWQVFAFRDPELADSVVFLTESHDDVWRNGYKLDRVRLGGEGGPLAPAPGSPFLRDGGKWTFAP